MVTYWPMGRIGWIREWFVFLMGLSSMVWDFITLLRKAINLKLINFWNFSFIIFGLQLTAGKWNCGKQNCLILVRQVCQDWFPSANMASEFLCSAKSALLFFSWYRQSWSIALPLISSYKNYEIDFFHSIPPASNNHDKFIFWVCTYRRWLSVTSACKWQFSMV